MKGLEGVYIVNKTEANLLFSLDLLTQGSQQFNLSVFSSIITAFQSFASEFKQKEAKRIDLGHGTILYSRVNEEYNIIFVIRCGKSMKEVKADELLEKLMKTCIFGLKFNGISSKEIGTVTPSMFEKDVFEVVKEKISLF